MAALDLQGLPPIRCGAGVAAGLPEFLAPLFQRVLWVRGQRREALTRVLECWRARGRVGYEWEVSGEPTVAQVQAAVEQARHWGIEAVIGWGGGSAIDFAKAVAGLAMNPGSPLDYLEVVGRGLPFTAGALPWWAVPTTAGTGAEVTRNAVLAVEDQRVKVSLRSPHLLARGVWLDPDLLLGLPLAVRRDSGLDALTQLIEAYVSAKANFASDVWCEGALAKVAKALPRWAAGDDALELREAMAWGALASGAALALGGLGAVHGLAGPLGGYLSAPHGALCAALLAPVMRTNLAFLSSAAKEAVRYQRIAEALTGRPGVDAAQGAAWVEEWVHRLQVPKLRAWGLREEDFPLVVEQAARASSMKGNPVTLTAADLQRLLAEAW